MAKIAYPSLSARSNPYLKKPEHVALSLIQFMFTNPGSSSALNEDEMISFRKLASKYNNRPEELSEKIGDALTTALARYFPDGNYIASCGVEMKVGEGEAKGVTLGTYGITIAITTADSSPICPRASIEIGPHGEDFKLHLI